ncbi:MAG: ABC transporter substrate-binding protein, partial [Corynebacterium variabile]
MRRLLTALFGILGLLASLALAGCAGTGGATELADGRYELKYQGTPGSVNLPELAEDLGYFDNIALNRVSDTSSGPISIQNVATGETDFGSAFNGAIAKLRASGAKITGVV